MMFARLVLTIILAVSLALSTGCQETGVDSKSSLDSAGEQPSQSRQDETDQSSAGNKSSATSEPQSADADRRDSDLQVDVDKNGVDVRVGEAVDVSVGEHGVDVDVPPDRAATGGEAKTSDARPKN